MTEHCVTLVNKEADAFLTVGLKGDKIVLKISDTGQMELCDDHLFFLAGFFAGAVQKKSEEANKSP